MFEIRWMIRRDMPEVLEVERSSPYPEVWGKDDFIRYLRVRNSIGMVVEKDHTTIVGYLLYALRTHTVWLHRIAVHEDHRNLGYGFGILKKMKGKVDKHSGRNRLLMDVPDTMLDAHNWLAKHDFKAVRVIGGSHYRFEYNTDEKSLRRRVVRWYANVRRYPDSPVPLEDPCLT